MKKLLLLLLIATSLSACAPVVVRGRVGVEVPLPIIEVQSYNRHYYERQAPVRWHYIRPTRRTVEEIYYDR